MVSYFVPRGRFLMKVSNLRQAQKPPSKWPLFRNFRQSMSPKSSTTSTNGKAEAKVEDVIKQANVSKALQEQKFNTSENCADAKQRSIWLRWTRLLLRLAPVGICFFGAIEWQWHKYKCEKDNLPKTASQFQSKVYCCLPLRLVSRCWGWLAACYVPVPFRDYLYGWYSSAFNVNMEEALHADYKHYNSLAEFFTRPLKEGARFIDPTAPLVSPADGKVLHFGSAMDHLIEQVKGVSYSIESFLGPASWTPNYETGSSSNVAELLKEKRDGSTELYQCVIYLAPGDYHRFHSPAEWQPTMRRHFTGKLLSVSPKVATWLPGLFCLNERVLYMGKWQHGFFSYTAVGATNVGSVQIFMDEELKTNCWNGLNVVGLQKKKNEFNEYQLNKDIRLTKGELVGQFNMGSTIVLLFEAPKNFKFNIEPGQKIQVGQPLGFLE